MVTIKCLIVTVTVMSTILDKMIENYRNKMNQHILDNLIISIQDKINEKTNFENDQVMKLEIMTLEELNETLDRSGYRVIDGEYFERYFDKEFYLEKNIIVTDVTRSSFMN